MMRAVFYASVRVTTALLIPSAMFVGRCEKVNEALDSFNHNVFGMLIGLLSESLVAVRYVMLFIGFRKALSMPLLLL